MAFCFSLLSCRSSFTTIFCACQEQGSGSILTDGYITNYSYIYASKMEEEQPSPHLGHVGGREQLSLRTRMN
jgi:hypothetical protein